MKPMNEMNRGSFQENQGHKRLDMDHWIKASIFHYYLRHFLHGSIFLDPEGLKMVHLSMKTKLFPLNQGS